MKIAFSVLENKGQDSVLDSRFGRAGGFMIFDGQTWVWADNTQNVNSPSGAGIQAAQNMVNAGVEVFVGGHVGPKAFKVLSEAGVVMFQGKEGLTVRESLLNYQNGAYPKLEEANSVGF